MHSLTICYNKIAEFQKAVRQGNTSLQYLSEEKKDTLMAFSGKRASLLDKAEIDATKGWSCPAWTDIGQCKPHARNQT